jgi:hypothetical protein
MRTFGYTPAQYLSLPQREKAFVIAEMIVHSEDEKKRLREIERKRPKGKRR